MGHLKRKFIFQPIHLLGAMLVSGRVIKINKKERDAIKMEVGQVTPVFCTDKDPKQILPQIKDHKIPAPQNFTTTPTQNKPWTQKRGILAFIFHRKIPLCFQNRGTTPQAPSTRQIKTPWRSRKHVLFPLPFRWFNECLFGKLPKFLRKSRSNSSYQGKHHPKSSKNGIEMVLRFKKSRSLVERSLPKNMISLFDGLMMFI